MTALRAMLPRLGLPLLLLFLGFWGSRAVVLDNHPAYSESVFGDSTVLFAALTRPDRTLSDYLESAVYRPPLSYLPATLLYLVTGPRVVVLRLTVLLQYLALVWLAHGIGRSLADRRAGLLAAVLVGTFPLIFGFGRVCYIDMALTLMLMLCLRLLVTWHGGSFRRGVGLGLAAGLGLLTKVAFVLFMLGPALWILGFKLRRLRQLQVLMAAAATVLAVAGWWYVLQWDKIVLNVSMSQAAPGAPLGARLSSLAGPDHGPWLLTLAIVGLLVSWRWRTLPRERLVLLGGSLIASALVLTGFQPEPRYALPVFAIAAVLAGLTLSTAVSRFGRRVADLAVAALCVALLAEMVWLNLAEPAAAPHDPHRPVIPREETGMIAPERGDFGAYARAVAAARRHGLRRCLLASTGVLVTEKHGAQDLQLRAEGTVPLALELDVAALRARPDGEPCALLVTGPGGGNEWTVGPQREHGYYRHCLAYAWLMSAPGTRRVASFGPSPNGLRYELLRLAPDALSRDMTPAPYCRLEQAFWDKVLHR